MLWLRRNIHWNQLEKCDISGELIYPGDYFYVDDEDGVKIKATVYKDIKDKEKEETWDYTKLNNAANEAEYKEMIKLATMQTLTSSVLERKIAGKYDPKRESDEVNALYSHLDKED